MLNESYAHVKARSEDSLTRVKEIAHLSKSYRAKLDHHLQSATNSAQTLDIAVQSTSNRREIYIEHQQSLQSIRKDKLISLQDIAESEHFLTSKAWKVQKKAILQRAKVRKRLAAAKQTLSKQKQQRKLIIMCHAVLYMARFQLGRKFAHMTEVFHTPSMDDIIATFNQSLIQECLHSTDLEAKLEQHAKLEATFRSLSRELAECKKTHNSQSVVSYLNMELRFHPEDRRKLQVMEDKVAQQSAALFEKQIDVSHIVASLVAILIKFDSIDACRKLSIRPKELYAQLATSQTNPSVIAVTLMILEKSLIASLETIAQRNRLKREDNNPLANALWLMMQNAMKKQQASTVDAKSKEYFGSHFIKQKSKDRKKRGSIGGVESLLKSVASLEAKALEQVKSARMVGGEKLPIDLEAEELERAIAEMREYKDRVSSNIKKSHPSPDFPPLISSPPPLCGSSLTRELFTQKNLFDLNKRMIGIHSRGYSEVNLKTETADFFLNMKKDK